MVNLTLVGSKLSSSPLLPTYVNAAIFFYLLPQRLAIKHLQVILLQQFGARDTQIGWRREKEIWRKEREDRFTTDLLHLRAVKLFLGPASQAMN